MSLRTYVAAIAICTLISPHHASAQTTAAPASRATGKPKAATPAGTHVPVPKAATPPEQSPKPESGLTNDDVIKMVKAGLSDQVILGAIEASPKKAVDLSPAGLIALKGGGVSDQIILALQGRPRAPEVASVPSLPPAPAQANVATAKAPAAPLSTADNQESDQPKPKGGLFGRLAKVKDIRIGSKNDAASATTGAAKPKDLKNGETAVVKTSLSFTDTTTKVKEFFNSKDIEFTVNPDTGRITTGWFADHRCGPGIQHCENRAVIGVADEAGNAVVRVQVMERKREGGLSEKPWHENSESRGKETAKLASDLESFFGTSK